MKLPLPIPIKLTKENSLFFDDLVTTLFNLIASAQTIRFQLFQNGVQFGPESRIHLPGIHVKEIFQLYPYQFLEPFSRNQWVDELIIYAYDSTIYNLAENSVSLDVLKGVNVINIESGFTHYYERIQERVKAKFGGYSSWPEEINFARVIRNAFAHNGKIKFNTPSATPVSWRGLTYAPSDNGKQILFTELTLIELVHLSMDIDRHLID